jgi:hypothetical protein
LLILWNLLSRTHDLTGPNTESDILSPSQIASQFSLPFMSEGYISLQKFNLMPPCSVGQTNMKYYLLPPTGTGLQLEAMQMTCPSNNSEHAAQSALDDQDGIS